MPKYVLKNSLMRKINAKVFTNIELTAAEEIVCESILDESRPIELSHLDFCFDIELCSLVQDGPSSQSISGRMKHIIETLTRYMKANRYEWVHDDVSRYIWDCCKTGKTDSRVLFKSKNTEITVSLADHEILLYKNGKYYRKPLTSRLINSIVSNVRF